MTRYGYARVSTDEQNLGRQIDALTAHGVLPEHLHQETASGAAPHRPVLDRLMSDVLTEGDTLVVTDLDRLSRRTSRLILTLDERRPAGSQWSRCTSAWTPPPLTACSR